jgi:hypothetical protein
MRTHWFEIASSSYLEDGVRHGFEIENCMRMMETQSSQGWGGYQQSIIWPRPRRPVPAKIQLEVSL